MLYGDGPYFQRYFLPKNDGLLTCKVSVCILSHVGLFAMLWTVAHHPPLSMGFSRQEYWSRSPFPPPGDLPDPGIKPRSPALQVDSLPSEPPGKPKNTGVDSLSLLQGNFLTQESNWGLLHCRQIRYNFYCSKNETNVPQGCLYPQRPTFWVVWRALT